MSNRALELIEVDTLNEQKVHGHASDKVRYIATDGNLLAKDDPITRRSITMPTFCTVSYNMMYGKWLSLGNGDLYSECTKESIVNEQTNVAVTAALLLTIEFAFFFMIPSLDFNVLLDNFDYSGGSIAAKWFNDATYAISIFYITVTCLSMVYCMMMLLVLGEMNQEELRDYVRIMGTKINQGFLLFFVGLTSLALHVGATVFLGTKTWGGRMFALCFCGIPVGIIIMGTYTPMILNLYKVKLERGLPEKLANSGPCVSGVAELQQQLDEFLKVINPEHLSVENFSQWVKEQHADKRKFSACLASLTKKRLEIIVEQYFEKKLQEEQQLLDKKLQE
jgi:hypothetical protein